MAILCPKLESSSISKPWIYYWIEVKIVNRWKEALGHLLVKSESYPDRQRRLHLYGTTEIYESLDRIQTSCRNMSTIVTYEFTPTPKALV